MPPAAEEMQEVDDQEGPVVVNQKRGKSLSEYLSLDKEQQQELIVFIMQMGFTSMAISLLMTGCILISVVGGLNDPTTILAIQYTSWASLGAIGLISLMVIVLNIVSFQFNQD
jgi:hypothetical protein